MVRLSNPLVGGMLTSAVALLLTTVNLPPLARPTDTLRDVVLPLTVCSVVPGALVAIVLFVRDFRAWNRQRRASGVCGSCGYDLRASPGRCPECGTAAAAPADSPTTPHPPAKRPL